MGTTLWVSASISRHGKPACLNETCLNKYWHGSPKQGGKTARFTGKLNLSVWLEPPVLYPLNYDITASCCQWLSSAGPLKVPTVEKREFGQGLLMSTWHISIATCPQGLTQAYFIELTFAIWGFNYFCIQIVCVHIQYAHNILTASMLLSKDVVTKAYCTVAYEPMVHWHWRTPLTSYGWYNYNNN